MKKPKTTEKRIRWLHDEWQAIESWLKAKTANGHFMRGPLYKLVIVAMAEVIHRTRQRTLYSDHSIPLQWQGRFIAALTPGEVPILACHNPPEPPAPKSGKAAEVKVYWGEEGYEQALAAYKVHLQNVPADINRAFWQVLNSMQPIDDLGVRTLRKNQDVPKKWWVQFAGIRAEATMLRSQMPSAIAPKAEPPIVTELVVSDDQLDRVVARYTARFAGAFTSMLNQHGTRMLDLLEANCKRLTIPDIKAELKAGVEAALELAVEAYASKTSKPAALVSPPTEPILSAREIEINFGLAPKEEEVVVVEVLKRINIPPAPVKSLAAIPRPKGDKCVVFIYDLVAHVRHDGGDAYKNEILCQLAPNINDALDLKLPNVFTFVDKRSKWEERDLTLYCSTRNNTKLTQDDWVQYARQRSLASQVVDVPHASQKVYADILNGFVGNWLYPE